MKHLKISIEKVLMLFLISILLINFTQQNLVNDIFDKTKSALSKNLNQKHLNNYLRQMMLKKNEIADDSFVFLTNEDLDVEANDLNYSTLQTDKKDGDEFKARVIAYKWGNQNLGKGKVKPYSVRLDSENPHKWKSYVVLLMGDGVNSLKKVCFPTGTGDNVAVVVKHDKRCSDKINKIYEYNIMEDSNKEEEQQQTKVKQKKIKHLKKHKKSHKKNKNKKENERFIDDILTKKHKKVHKKKHGESSTISKGVNLKANIPSAPINSSVSAPAPVQSVATTISEANKKVAQKPSSATVVGAAKTPKKVNTDLSRLVATTTPAYVVPPSSSLQSATTNQSNIHYPGTNTLPSKSFIKNTNLRSGSTSQDKHDEEDDLRDIENKSVNLQHVIYQAHGDMNLQKNPEKNKSTDIEDLRMS